MNEVLLPCKNYDSYCEWCTALEYSLEFRKWKEKIYSASDCTRQNKSLRGKTQDPQKQLTANMTRHIYPLASPTIPPCNFPTNQIPILTGTV